MILCTQKATNAMRVSRMYNHDTIKGKCHQKAEVLELSKTQMKWNYTGYLRINQPLNLTAFTKEEIVELDMECSYTALKDNTSSIDHCSCTDKVVLANICKHYHGKKCVKSS